MKRNFTILFFGLASLFAAGCTAVEVSNENQNAAVVAATPATAANANENTAAKMPEEVPVFTDADEAAAAGDKYLDAVETENAINAFRQAVKLNPDFGDAYFKLGIAYSLREKEGSESAQETEEEPTPTPKPSKSKKGKKDVAPPLDDAGKAFENAAKAYEKILKKSPKDDLALYNLGRAYNKLNKDKEAEKALRQAYKIKPEDVEYGIEFGSILMKLAQYDEAVNVLAKTVKLDDTNLQAQDLLEKAEAGKKRINFGIKPKPPQQQQQREENSSPSKPNKPKPKPTAAPSTQPPPKPVSTP